ncbi:peptidoglycan DD-metalloendopeptidase family protein [Nocardioides insulae]|uniref:peptidoglycan DD-metalloendopeptidase family protein n=1 Tax=Nocardioides insulae TaxID=394734 RepID=UPI000403F8FD|nr:peptidoglycan DD-metalloendopeptidase family protein [Nocardioides insulae]
MAAHRANCEPDHRPGTGSPETPYVGKRARRDAPPVETPPSTPYVGKRARRDVPGGSSPLAPAPVTSQRVAPAPIAPQRVAPAPKPAEPLTATGRSVAPAATRAPSAPAQAHPRPLERVGRDELPGEITAEFDAIVARHATQGAWGESDFAEDPTTAMPWVRDGGGELAPLVSTGEYVGRRRAEQDTARRGRRGRPGMPIVVGVATLSVAAVGALSTTGEQAETATAAPIQASGAVTASGSVGAEFAESDRNPTISRNLSRTDTSADEAEAAETLAADREQALTQLDQQASGQAAKLKANQWGLPVEAGVYHITNTFGLSRSYYASTHTGLDFAAPSGTPIHAVAGGTVTSTGYEGSYGNQTIITLEDGTEIWYCHQTSFAVSPGDTVATGDVIGYVGSTGNSTGPHVHVEVRPGGGDPVDPYTAMVHQGLQP